ncbi:MAG TPA: RDD family protein [Candidatus Eisenbacteria bacterium]|nr:RDD family protein [Candidatus Eisenbacteria bacterium]
MSAFQGPAGAPPEDLVVATPERVAFRFETAGLGSRFAAQLIDLLVLWGVLLALGLVSYGIGALLGQATVAVLVFLVFGFLSFWAYWILSEALSSGQTVGKYVLHLRVIDARGGPVGVGQALIRNLLRIVDFLPASYALGTVVMFTSARNQRLGDLAAGTVVIRERLAVRLADLDYGEPRESDARAAGRPPGPRLEPRLERFVRAYAQRRHGLTPERRAQLAAEAEPALRAALPDVAAVAGPLVALDQLADRELG